MQPTEFLAQLASQFGMAKLNLDANRVCRLTFDDSLVVDFEFPESNTSVNLTGTVGRIPEQQREKLFVELLEFNLPSEEPWLPVCAVDSQSGEVLLCHTESLHASDLQEFMPRFDQFLAHLVDWKEKLSSSDHRQPTQAAEPVQFDGPTGGHGIVKV